MRISFYAPLKAPDHPVPSGDRQMARMLIAALRAGGHDVAIASTFRSFLPVPDATRMLEIEARAEDEIARLIAGFEADGPPDLWFCYHPYFKAPDLLVSRVAARFGLPMATAEASHAGKRADGPWAGWHRINEAALRGADLQICFTPRDAEGLASLVPAERIVMLPPFIDAGPFGAVGKVSRGSGRVELVTVAMMRAGDKARSYAFLAGALAALPPDLDWRLTIVGDGPERRLTETAFAIVPGQRIVWAGEQDAAGVAAAMAQADLYLWPGFGEAYGVAYLEAAATGLPSLAMDCGGIASVVTDGVTGLLTPEGDLDAYARSLAILIRDTSRRAKLGEEARRVVLEERTVLRAATILSDALVGCGARRTTVACP